MSAFYNTIRGKKLYWILPFKKMGVLGLEPKTHALKGRCSAN